MLISAVYYQRYRLLFASSTAFFCILQSCAALASTMASTTAKITLPLDTLAAAANAYASTNGIQVERKTVDTNGDSTSVFQGAPISLLPQAYPKSAFDQATTLAPLFNVLVDRISRDRDFLQQTLGGSVSAQDPYTAKLLQLYHKVYGDEGTNHAATSADRLGIFRSDYMLNRQSVSDDYEIKQVELNTIASSFASLACQIANLHTYLIQRFAPFDPSVTEFLLQNQQSVVNVPASEADEGVPSNPTLVRLPFAMNVAAQRYKERFRPAKSVVLFVVQEGETNTVDQRMLEFRLFAQHQIPVVRLSLRQINDTVTLTDNGVLMLEDGTEIAVVYFRAGYAPSDYPDGDSGVEWQAREKLELSRATKCPTLGYHLAGTKKVQQELARPGVLERFFPDDSEGQVQKMRRAFAGLYSLGDDAVDEDIAAVRDVLLAQGHSRYVLKPQREGGGYNFYGEQLAAKLRDNVVVKGDTLELDEKLGEFILMERLFPPQQRAVLLRSGKVEGVGDTISELGCYGTVVVAQDGTIVHNEYAGFLLRTKFSNVDEGGVASGFATLSSPYLC
jgi:glutathione synthase